MNPCFRAALCLVFFSRGVEVFGAEDYPIKVFVDGSLSPRLEERISIKHHSSTVRFESGTDTIRKRYKLEGLDQDWLPQLGEMKFVVRFVNSDGDQVLHQSYEVAGDSAGWRGSVGSSLFTPRSEELTVPEGAEFVSISMSSAGPRATVGIIAIRGISVRSVSLEKAVGDDYLDGAWVPGRSLASWNKSGTHPSMASSLELEGSPVLVIEDDDVTAHADWEMKINLLPRVSPGEKLSVEWEEAYTMGLGEGVSVEYERLRPGDYRFVVEGVDLAGGHSGRVSTVDLQVTRPYWEEFWFWGVTLVAVLGLSIFLVRRVVRKRVERERQENQLIADERLRIARDLHDDLGTRLSHIYLLGSQAESANTEDGDRERFRQITQMSGELIGSLSETVWMLNANNGDLESLVNFLCRLVGELCKLSEIRCRIDALSVDETMPVSHEFRHSISLAVKETINNALKHSSASEIQMKVSKEGSNLRIVVRDNGVGIDPSANSAGSGLKSVTQRMEVIGGSYSLEELEEGGVRVILEAPILA